MTTKTPKRTNAHFLKLAKQKIKSLNLDDDDLLEATDVNEGSCKMYSLQRIYKHLYDKFGEADLQEVFAKENIDGKINLSNVDLSEANLNYSNLSNMIFDGAIFTRAMFNDVDVFKSDFSRANFLFADLNSSEFTACKFNRARFSNSKIINSNFSDSVFDHATFSGSELISTSFDQSKINSTIFRQSSFDDVNFDEIIGDPIINGSCFKACKNVPEYLQKIIDESLKSILQAQQVVIPKPNNMTPKEEFLKLAQSKLGLSDDRVESLARVYEHVCNTQGEKAMLMLAEQSRTIGKINLVGANLTKADLKKAVLYEVDFYGARFYKTDFSETDLSQADFKFTNIDHVNFSGANLNNANFEDTDYFPVLSELQLSQIKKPAKPQTQTKQESKPMMSIKKSIAETLKSDLMSASYEVAATQITKGTKAALINLLKSQGMNKSQMAGIVSMLDTELGTAFVSFITGMGLTYAPMISEDPRAQILAEKFRVKGMATAGNVVMGEVMNNFMPMIKTAIESLPQDKIRVEELSTNDSVEEDHVEEKQAKVRSIK